MQRYHRLQELTHEISLQFARVAMLQDEIALKCSVVAHPHVCSVLQCVAMGCSVSQCVAVCGSVLQSVTECCSGLQWVESRCCKVRLLCDLVWWRILMHAVSCNVLQCVVVCICCSVLQCVELRCRKMRLL